MSMVVDVFKPPTSKGNVFAENELAFRRTITKSTRLFRGISRNCNIRNMFVFQYRVTTDADLGGSRFSADLTIAYMNLIFNTARHDFLLVSTPISTVFAKIMGIFVHF